MKIFFIFMSVLYSSIALSAGDIGCRYLSKYNPELVERANCLTITNSSAEKWDALISKFVALDASYNDMGLAHLYSSEGLFYFQMNGKIMRTMMYDNGPDFFSEGLVRTVRDDKYGFMDKHLNIKIERQYDFASPFSNGKAKVCVGCKKISDGEHSWYEGGVSYFINKLGQKID